MAEIVPKKKPGKKRSPDTSFNDFEVYYYVDKAREKFGVGVNKAASMVAEQWGEITEASKWLAKKPEKVRGRLSASTAKHLYSKVRKKVGR